MTEMNQTYTREERAIASDIHDYRVHVRYHRKRAEYLEKEIERLQGILLSSMEARGMCSSSVRSRGNRKKTFSSV